MTSRRLLAGALGALLLLAPSAEARMRLLGAGGGKGAAAGCLVSGCPTALVITSGQWTNISDAGTLPIVSGWTGDMTFKGMATTPGTSTVSGVGATTNTSFADWQSQTGMPNYSTPDISFAVTSPGYDNTGAATTTTRAIQAVAPLRGGFLSTYGATVPPPVVLTSGSDAVASLAFNDYTYASDTPGNATVKANTYLTNRASTSVPVTNNSAEAYPEPIGAWVTEPGLRMASGGTITVEFFATHFYAQNGKPLAALKMRAQQGANATAWKTATLQQSTKIPSTACNATNGSNILTDCGSIAWVKLGQRLTVPGVPGQPVVGAIDPASGGNCPTSHAPCIELYVQETATFNSDGSITVGTLPSAGFAFADGGFVGQRVEAVGDAAWGTSGKAVIVAPSALCVSCNASGTAITMPSLAAGQGQWRNKMWLYDENVAPCIPTDTGTNTSEYFNGNTSTLKIAALGNCNGHTLKGIAIASDPTGTAVTTIDVSTAASGTSSATTAQFDHDFQGSTGSVTVTAGNPVPVYSVTFADADFSGASFTQGAVAIRAQGFPQVGDQILDTQYPNFAAVNVKTTGFSSSASSVPVANCGGIFSNPLGIDAQRGQTVNVYDVTSGVEIGTAGVCSAGSLAIIGAGAQNAASNGDVLSVGTNTNCDWWFYNFNNNSGVCTPSNAGWFAATGQNVSVQLHNLFAYYDTNSKFTPVYAWVAGSAGGSPAVQATSADPGSAAYYGSISTAFTALASYNNSNRSHNDVNGGVVCLTVGAAGIGASPTGTAWTPGLTLTSAATGSPCPGPGTAIAQTNFQTLSNGTIFTTPAGTRVQNLKFVAASGSIIQGADNSSSLPSAFPSGWLVADNIAIQNTGAPSGDFLRYAAVYGNNVYANAGSFATNFLAAFNGVPMDLAMLTGSTAICGAYGNQTVKMYLMSALGDVTWDCALTSEFVVGGAHPIALMGVIGYFKGMGMATVGVGQNINSPLAFATQANFALVEDVFETLNTKASNNDGIILGGDNYVYYEANILEQSATETGGRHANSYSEGGMSNYFANSATVICNTTQGGTCMSTASYSAFPGYTRASNPTATAPTAVDNPIGGNNYTTVAITATNSMKTTLPCDFENNYWIYLKSSTFTTSAPFGDVGIFNTGTTSGSTLTLTSAPVGSLLPGATLTDNAGATIVTAGGAPVEISACPGNNCSALGAYGLTGTPSSALTNATTYHAEATNLRACQIVYLLEPNPANQTIPVSGDTFPQRFFAKKLWSSRANNVIDMNQKADWSTALATQNQARMGNLAPRFGVGWAGNVYPGLGYTGLCCNNAAQIADANPASTYNRYTGSTYSDMSSVRYACGDDRSIGGADSNTTVLTFPALNIGSGHARPTSASVYNNGRGVVNKIAAGMAQMPWDIGGNAIPNDGTGSAGAYQLGSCQ